MKTTVLVELISEFYRQMKHMQLHIQILRTSRNNVIIIVSLNCYDVKPDGYIYKIVCVCVYDLTHTANMAAGIYVTVRKMKLVCILNQSIRLAVITCKIPTNIYMWYVSVYHICVFVQQLSILMNIGYNNNNIGRYMENFRPKQRRKVSKYQVRGQDSDRCRSGRG